MQDWLRAGGLKPLPGQAAEEEVLLGVGLGPEGMAAEHNFEDTFGTVEEKRLSQVMNFVAVPEVKRLERVLMAESEVERADHRVQERRVSEVKPDR